MKNLTNKMMKLQFEKVDNAVWDLSTGQLGIRTEDGIATLHEDEIVELNPIDEFGMEVPAFAQATPIDQIKVRDIIYANGKLKGWVIEIKDNGKFGVMTIGGMTTTWTPPQTKMMGMTTGVKVLRSLINTLPNGDLGNMQNMLMPLMMMGGDLDEMMPLLLMSGGESNMMTTMLMMKMIGKNNSTSNFFGD